MHRVLVLGAGKIGSVIAGLLADSGDYEVQLADACARTARAAAQAHGLAAVQPLALDAVDAAGLRAHVTHSRPVAVISCLPYRFNGAVATLARELDLHYFDLTEDVGVTREVRAAAAGARSAFAPQCGLAPGFISIVAHELITHFEQLRAVKLRVGALPQHPNNVLKYSLTWSTEGLINEYGNPCEAIVDGERCTVMPLEGLEEIVIDGTLYEAFNTSGGLGSLADSYAGRVARMDYKTMRYPGHCSRMRLLMNDLMLNADRPTLKRILENAVSQTMQDVVIVYAAVEGMQDGQFREETYVNKIYPQTIAGRLWSAIQVTTAAGACTVVDTVLGDPDRFAGFVPMERFRLADVLDNRFGRYFAYGGTSELSARMVTEGRRSLADREVRAVEGGDFR